METLDLKEIESRAYGTRSDNGLLDIVIGAGLLGYGLLAHIGAYLVPSYCMLIAVLLRRFVVIPRVGSVRFSAGRRARERAGLLLVALLVLIPIPAGLALFFADRLPAWTGVVATHPTLVLGLFIALALAAVAWAKSAGRFYVFAIMALLNSAGAQVFGQSHIVPMTATGAPILVVGIILMTRFVMRNPVQRPEAA